MSAIFFPLCLQANKHIQEVDGTGEHCRTADDEALHLLVPEKGAHVTKDSDTLLSAECGRIGIKLGGLRPFRGYVLGRRESKMSIHHLIGVPSVSDIEHCLEQFAICRSIGARAPITEHHI